MQSPLNAITERLNRALKRAGRAPESCRILAVSKTHSAEAITKVANLGQVDFGENRVQEARDKFPPPRERPPGQRLHLIGPLQSNKVRQAVQHFDAIHSLDRPKLVGALARIVAEEGRRPHLFIQVNTGEEPQKAGCLPQDLAALVAQARAANLPLVGLMCIPPLDQAPAPHFAFLAQRARELGLSELSMGMSQDFEAAAELGATYVRVGTAIFGARLGTRSGAQGVP